jgi:outer membrane protein assembly factor BamB
MIVALLAVTFVHLWTHVERGWMLGIPTAANGIVYTGTTTGDVVALDASDGHVLWRAVLGANSDETYGNPRGVISSVAVSGGVAYAVSGSCEAAALDARRGKILWKRRICTVSRNDDTYASPAVADGRVLFGIDMIADRPTDTGREIALDASTGKPAWSFTPVRYRGTGGGISATVAIDSHLDLAVVGTGNPTPMSAPPPGADRYTDSVIAFEPANGDWRWVTGPLIPHDANDYDIFASPRLLTLHVRGRTISAVAVVLKDGRCVMLDERDGRILWQRQTEPAMSWMLSIGTPALTGDTLIVPLYRSAADGELVALRGNDGAVLWRTPTAGIYEAPVIWHATVLAAEAQGAIDAFDLRTGRRIARLPVNSKLLGHGLALAGDVLLVAGRGRLWAYRLQGAPD